MHFSLFSLMYKPIISYSHGYIIVVWNIFFFAKSASRWRQDFTCLAFYLVMICPVQPKPNVALQSIELHLILPLPLEFSPISNKYSFYIGTVCQSCKIWSYGYDESKNFFNSDHNSGQQKGPPNMRTWTRRVRLLWYFWPYLLPKENKNKILHHFLCKAYDHYRKIAIQPL